MKRIGVAAIVLLGITSMFAVAGDPMKAFPPPEEGMVRYVLRLPEQEDETAFKVELIVGKTVRMDAANRYFLSGELNAENISGWGFTRYVVETIGPLAGTLMAVDPNLPTVDRFIALAGEPYLIRYNSRLPVVVYVPEGASVRYRIWRAEPEIERMEIE